MERFPPTVVCFLNRKGGVGKTSTVHHLGGVFAQAGRRVLVVDMDPQFSLTQGLLGAKAALSLPAANTVAALFDDSLDPDPDSIIRPTAFEGLDLAPCGTSLNGYNLPDPHLNLSLQGALALFVAEVRDRYDIVLIDCPPNLNLCSWAALLAADAAVVPLQPEDYGSQGIIHVRQFVALAAQRANPRLRLLGYLLTMVRLRLGIHVAYRQQLQAQYGDAVFAADVPDLTHFKEAITVQTPVSYYKPKSKAADAIRAVADEIVGRVVAGRFPVENAPVAEGSVA